MDIEIDSQKSPGSSEASYFYHVAVEAPLSSLLTYSSATRMTPGAKVLVPLGKRRVQGVIVTEVDTPTENFEVKSILEQMDEYPPLPRPYLKWLKWISNYYIYPPGLVFSNCYPPLKKHTKRAPKGPLIPEIEPSPPPRLTEDQVRCVKSISQVDGFGAHLLFGVTGSGKTEVYLQLIQKVLEKNQQVLVLVPEISLTPQHIKRFASRFGQSVAVYHSQLTEREKTTQWWEMVDNKKQILIGARSALFCPMPNLGLIILDEEHEPSFKQEETFRYHARDAAILLAKYLNCPIVLGSATPSLETWQNVIDKKVHLHELPTRVEGRPLPDIQIIDMKEVTLADKSESARWLSPQLNEKIRERLYNKEQVALFLNRRGVAQTILCPGCGATCECPNCSVALTLHAKVHLVCHYCDYHQTKPELCAECRQFELESFGIGTELIENELKVIFPEARIERADRDRISSRHDLEDMVNKMENREIDILIGTQMIAKGLDFTHLTLVGMLLADIGFNIPDFRSSERCFQLIMQMGGRAGRHKKPGEVIIQCFNTEHPSLKYSLNHDFLGFTQEELVNRKELLYPPYSRLACIRTQSLHQHQASDAIEELAKQTRTLIHSFKAYSSLEVLGPTEAPLFKLRGQYRYQFLIKSPTHAPLINFCQRLNEVQYRGVRVVFDIDPHSML